MNIINFNKERTEAAKKVADKLLELIYQIEMNDFTKEEIIDKLRVIEFKYRQEYFKLKGKQ